jgi:hypothetical protein
LKKLLLILFASLALGLSADDKGVVEPAGKDEALVFASFKFARALQLDPGPDTVQIVTIDPWITWPSNMGKDGSLFYMGNLKVGRVYRMNQWTAQIADRIVFAGLGMVGNDHFAIDVKEPGLLYLGDYEYNDTEGMHFVGKSQELALLRKLSGNLLFRPTWKKIVDNRIKELNP